MRTRVAATAVLFLLAAVGQMLAANGNDDDGDIDMVVDTYEGEDEHHSSEEKGQCASKNAICASMMRTAEREEPIDEGELCKCVECVRKWGDKKDKRAITWYHQERRDFVIQYRACSKVIPDNVCAADDKEMALKITTGVNNWKPRVAGKVKCRCKNGIYNIAGWWKKKGRWEYSYTCNLPTCDVSSHDRPVCVKQYRSEKGVNGVQFPCSCPQNYKCPLEEHTTKTAHYDEDGDYSVGHCVPLYGTGKKAPSS